MGRPTLVDEMGAGDLGDERLNARRARVLTALERAPDAGFPAACANEAETEALYRFLRNGRVSLEGLIEPHLQATQVRCRAVGDVLVIHDTTDMVFAGEATRPGLARLSKCRHGFWLHAALAVSADGLRAPLGLLSLMPFIRQRRPPDAPKPPTPVRGADLLKESRCWREGLGAVRARLAETVSPIHVMDRGADSYELFAVFTQHGDRFVVRLAQDRLVETPDGAGALSTVRPLEALGERQVMLAPRFT